MANTGDGRYNLSCVTINTKFKDLLMSLFETLISHSAEQEPWVRLALMILMCGLSSSIKAGIELLHVQIVTTRRLVQHATVRTKGNGSVLNLAFCTRQHGRNFTSPVFPAQFGSGAQ